MPRPAAARHSPAIPICPALATASAAAGSGTASVSGTECQPAPCRLPWAGAAVNISSPAGRSGVCGTAMGTGMHWAQSPLHAHCRLTPTARQPRCTCDSAAQTEPRRIRTGLNWDCSESDRQLHSPRPATNACTAITSATLLCCRALHRARPRRPVLLETPRPSPTPRRSLPLALHSVASGRLLILYSCCTASALSTTELPRGRLCCIVPLWRCGCHPPMQYCTVSVDAECRSVDCRTVRNERSVACRPARLKRARSHSLRPLQRHC